MELPKEKDLLNRDVPVKTLSGAILMVQEVLKWAQKPDTNVIICCRSLHYHLREKLWAAVSGSTFADQIEAAIDAGARVRLLLANELQAELISAKVVALTDQFEEDQFDMYSTGNMAFFKTFPHFTFANRNGEWAGYVEWDHRYQTEPDKLNAKDPVNGDGYFQTSHAAMYGAVLRTHFDTIFRKAKDAASKEQPQFAAYSITA